MSGGNNTVLEQSVFPKRKPSKRIVLHSDSDDEIEDFSAPADARVAENDTSSQSSFDNFIVDDSKSSAELGGTKEPSAKRRKTNAAAASSSRKESGDADVALLDASEDDEFTATIANEADISFALWLAKEETKEEEEKAAAATAAAATDAAPAAAAANSASAKKKPAAAAAATKRKTLPSSLQMARDLGVRYIAGIDPGDVNAAFVVYDAYEAAIVYWRVFKLAEIVRACESACDVRLSASSDVKEHRFRLEALMYAIRWWCSLDTCPLRRADLVCIESQDFSRRLASIEAAWYVALAGQKPAVDLHVNGGSAPQRFIVPKSYSVSADSVKTHFGSLWFPTLSAGARNATNSSGYSGSKPAWLRKKQAHGMGDANRESDTERAQYTLNKKKVAEWCTLLTTGAHAMNDLEARAVAHGKWMSSAQLDDTIERLGGKKADDLADALFIALYAADAVIPSLWKRALGPNAKRYKDGGYVLNQPPPQMSDRERKKMSQDGDAAADRIAEAHHQSLFVYAKKTARLGEARLQKMRSTLNRS